MAKSNDVESYLRDIIDTSQSAIRALGELLSEQYDAGFADGEKSGYDAGYQQAIQEKQNEP